jgi:hypothetical protein
MQKTILSRLLPWIRSLFYFGVVLALAKCGNSGSSGPASGTFTNVYVNTLNTACIQCHVPGGSAFAAGATIDFTTQTTAYQTLTTSFVSATDVKATCGAVKIVAANDPADSYLAGVLFKTYYKSSNFGVPGCSPYNAHLSDQNLSSAEQTSIITWIQTGAPNN